MSDDISMKALKYSISKNTTQAFKAGCNLVLHCNGKYKEMKHEKPTKEEVNPNKMKLRLQHNKWKENGLNNVKYKIVKNKKGEKVTKLNAYSVLVTINF